MKFLEEREGVDTDWFLDMEWGLVARLNLLYI